MSRDGVGFALMGGRTIPACEACLGVSPKGGRRVPCRVTVDFADRKFFASL